jgi:predicted DNA-binding transcriptional regulator YafY
LKIEKGKPQRVHLHAYERLREICVEIQMGRYPNKVDLSKKIERHPRTIQRDLDALRIRFDAPLKFDRRRNGFYFTDPDWRMPSIKLSQGEVISFFIADRILRRLGASAEVSIARQAIRSLAALLPQEVVVDLGALEEAISFAPEPALDASPVVLHKLTAAAMNRQTLFIKYYSQHRDTHTEREVDVLLVHNYLGEWYAVGYDHLSREIRDFHAGRITHLVNTRRRFIPPADWEAENYLKQGFGMFRGGGEVEVEIEFDAYQARYARERTYHPTQKRQELPDGRLRLTFKTTEAALEQVARWLMQYGEHGLALRPLALREMMRERVQKTLTLYEG